MYPFSRTHHRGLSYVVSLFTKTIYSTSRNFRYCFKFHRLFLADGVAKQNRPTRYRQQQQTALNIFKDYLILKSITVIENNDIFFNDGIFNDIPKLAIFRCNNKNEKFMSHKKLPYIKMQVLEVVF